MAAQPQAAQKFTRAERRQAKLESPKIAERIRAYSRVARELDARMEKLTEQYPDQWAALYHDGKDFQLLTAATQEELLRKVDEMGIARSAVAVECLNSKRQTFIL